MDNEISRESAVEYFTDLVDHALDRQGLHADRLTSAYVVNLLAGFLRPPVGADEPLALQLLRVLEGDGGDRRQGFKQIGDAALFTSGFFSDSLHASIDYYVAMGRQAYATLSYLETDARASVYGELAGKFVGFVDVLSDVSERTSCTTSADLLRLYERWLKTGSVRSGRLLVEHGVVTDSGSVRIH